MAEEQIPGGTILIVEDTKFMRLMLRDIFERNGYEVIGEAVNGKEGVEKYEELLPDLTTLDISMPEMDGIETLRAIMKIDPAAKVVMVSAMGYKDKIMDAVKSGAKDFIIKPFEEKKVLSVVQNILKK